MYGEGGSICLRDKAKIALFFKIIELLLWFKTPGQDRGAKTRSQGQLECANPGGRPGGGGWSGLKLTDTLFSEAISTSFWQMRLHLSQNVISQRDIQVKLFGYIQLLVRPLHHYCKYV